LHLLEDGDDPRQSQASVLANGPFIGNGMSKTPRNYSA
jgi:hypothetical protein